MRAHIAPFFPFCGKILCDLRQLFSYHGKILSCFLCGGGVAVFVQISVKKAGVRVLSDVHRLFLCEGGKQLVYI